ncbi:AraC-type DNA-binding protein [Chryseobacterium arachidis]|uniref:AraC-type DNA-binding protein n=1 Tax=Chryseobacterium arachidis TaxID=1416778 RepID=A0A1M4ZB23_9FLAO|nr:helix-turn-helix domain-containing protein [Chryseobacterium arachidis]SHF15231.1 AraC-type DNA-binding protein [Chryseobacterium arachidis]
MKKSLFICLVLISDFIFSQTQIISPERLNYENPIFIYSGIFAGITSIFGWQIWRKNKKNYSNYSYAIKNASEHTIEESINNFAEPVEEPEKNYYISTETANIILKKLVKFENDKKFLKKDITLTWLANNLGTNTKYLSETIKIHRNKNFNNYINGLRINYITRLLYSNPEYRQYKIVSLAKECGYSSSQVFVIAFKKENGIPPSYFIANLKNEGPDSEVSFQ